MGESSYLEKNPANNCRRKVVGNRRFLTVERREMIQATNITKSITETGASELNFYRGPERHAPLSSPAAQERKNANPKMERWGCRPLYRMWRGTDTVVSPKRCDPSLPRSLSSSSQGAKGRGKQNKNKTQSRDSSRKQWDNEMKPVTGQSACLVREILENKEEGSNLLLKET